VSFPRKLFFCLWLLFPATGAAVGELSFDLEALSGDALEVSGVHLALQPRLGLSFALEARIERLTVPATGDRFDDLLLRCPQVRFEGQALDCPNGSLRLSHPLLAKGTMPVALKWDIRRDRIDLRISDVGLAKGRWALALRSAADGTELEVQGQGANLGAVVDLLRRRGVTAVESLAGAADIRLKASIDDAGLRRAEWSANLADGGFSAIAGAWLGEGLAAAVSGRMERRAAGVLAGQVRVTLTSGALLSPYFYLEPGAEPVRLDAGFRHEAAAAQLLLVENLSYSHPGVLALNADARFDLTEGELVALRAETGPVDANALYRACLQPVLAGTLLERVGWTGGLLLNYRQAPGQPLELMLDLRELGLSDQPADGAAPRFAVSGLNGTLAWSDREEKPVRLSWDSAELFGALRLGTAALEGGLAGGRFRLVQPLELPVMDGRLLVDRLELDAGQGKSPSLDFDAVLTPVSMGRLSDAFGWPPLAGSVSGVIPGLALREGELTLNGNLLVRVFDGDLLIRNLRLSDLFGALPSLSADVEVNDLDLETLTGTFSFGKITGRLEGRVDGLRLENWRPVAFDARFNTPAGDDSPHAISQRAVDNISNLGGAGIGGSLSRGFLGMFEEFNYERLGISCRLEQGVCHMGGVQPAKQGYYLVVGRGIPQINIVGFNRKTDWDRLVEQLQQISAGGSPVVEMETTSGDK